MILDYTGIKGCIQSQFSLYSNSWEINIYLTSDQQGLKQAIIGGYLPVDDPKGEQFVSNTLK